MDLHHKEIFVIVILTLAIVFLNQNFKYTGYAVIEPSINLELEKDTYLINEKLDGKINITFMGNVDLESEVTVTVEGVSETIKLTDYLDAINESYGKTPEKTLLTNGQITKNLTLTAWEEKTVGFKVPDSAIVDAIIMTVAGVESNPTTLLSFDIPEDSGKFEWKYLGDLASYNTTPIYPEGLEIENEDTVQYLDSNLTYYCERINLPYAKDYTVSAKYKPVNGSKANLAAFILSFDGQVAYGGADRCNLPKGGDDFLWQSCSINLANGIQGYYLVCVGIDKSEKAYEIARDNAATTSKYNCDVMAWGEYLCNKINSRNYFIRVHPGKYTEKLTGTISPQNFNNWITDRDLSDSITRYLTLCEPDQLGDCGVAMKVKSETNGYLELRDLRIDYTEVGGGASYTNKFYEISLIPPEIYQIGNKTLNETTLEIPLSFFNITTPNVTRKELMEVIISFAGSSDTGQIKVYPTNIPEEVTEVEELINDAQNKLNKISEEDIGWLLDAEQKIQMLTSYEETLKNIKNANITLEEKENRTEEVKEEVLEFLDTLPESVNKLSQYSDTLVVESSDIEELFTGNQLEIFNFQGKIDADIKVTAYKVTQNDGTSETYSIISKTIMPRENLREVNVYEVVPKEVATSIQDITFQDTNFEVVRPDPVIKYIYNTLSPITMTYAVKKLVTQAEMYDLKTIVVPKKIPVETPATPEYKCGDNICSRPYEDETLCPEDCEQKTKIPWNLIFVILGIFLIGVIYINFYRGRLSLGKILIGKSPFKTSQDLENVKYYIKGQLQKKVKKSEISKALLAKGWTQEQVKYAFDDIEWDKKRDRAIKNAPQENNDMKRLTDYIVLCKRLNIPEEKITHVLKMRGWSDAQIGEGLARAKGIIGYTKQEIKREKPKPFFEQ